MNPRMIKEYKMRRLDLCVSALFTVFFFRDIGGWKQTTHAAPFPAHIMSGFWLFACFNMNRITSHMAFCRSCASDCFIHKVAT